MRSLTLTLIAMLLSIASFAVGPILGTPFVCTGQTTTLSDTTAGGTWSSSNVAVATVSYAGVVSGVSTGTAVISYVTGSGTATVTVTVNASPAYIGTGAGTVCVGATITVTDATPGGVWTSGSTAVVTIGSLTGVVTGIGGSTTFITYTLPSGCATSAPIDVFPAPATITGPSSFCVGTTATYTDSTAGGHWTSSMSSVAVIGSASGIATGIAVGATTITYTNGYGCRATRVVTVVPAPAAIGGLTDVCIGSTITLTDATSGGTWSITPTTIATIGASTGVVTGVAAGTATATYSLGSGCSVTRAITVDPLPATYTVTSSATSCGSAIHIGLSASAVGVSYQLYNGSTPVGSPISGSGAAIDFGIFSAAGTYTVMATLATTGCTAAMTGSVTISGNIISGDIYFSSTLPDTLDMKVWLIQYDATDSSLMATDSVLTCVSSAPHYEFTGKPSGNYMVKAKLIYGNPPGSTGYIPTYGASSIHWDSASTIVHTGGSSVQDITMIHGTVPAGPGFIGGLIVSGAGRGTTGEVPYAGMLVYLKDAATGNIITYTYSSSTGAYSFSGIAYGSYIVDPVEYHYYTTPSSVITLSASTPSVSTVNFKRRTTYGTIVPFIIVTTGNQAVANTTGITVYPNPASNYLTVQWNNQAMGNATAVVTDVTGREVYKTTFEMNTVSGQAQLSLPSLNNGMYIMSIKSNGLSYTERLTIEK